ncbi:MAG TPA: hypothetical protein VFS13_05705 [Steroidobacteraceae bacterium]|jgi:hypothetical protein|nr:hypothetical protein [Steroidobacteraceae bacterium]
MASWRQSLPEIGTALKRERDDPNSGAGFRAGALVDLLRRSISPGMTSD